MMRCDWVYPSDYPTIWFDERESVVIPIRALLERFVNQGINVALSHISVAQAT